MDEARPLTERERSVLHALLSAEFEGVHNLRRQAASATVVGGCECGCPSIDFEHGRALGMSIRVNAAIRDSDDGLFLYTIRDAERGERLGGIEYVGVGDEDPAEFPPAIQLRIDLA